MRGSLFQRSTYTLATFYCLRSAGPRSPASLPISSGFSVSGQPSEIRALGFCWEELVMRSPPFWKIPASSTFFNMFSWEISELGFCRCRRTEYCFKKKREKQSGRPKKLNIFKHPLIMNIFILSKHFGNF